MTQRSDNMVFTQRPSGHTFALWQRALALVDSLLVQTRSLRSGAASGALPVGGHRCGLAWLRGYNKDMNTEPQQLLATALSMPELDRANLAASLLRSLDPPDDPQADAAWAAEIRRRVESIDNGTAELRTWDDVISQMRQRRNG